MDVRLAPRFRVYGYQSVSKNVATGGSTDERDEALDLGLRRGSREPDVDSERQFVRVVQQRTSAWTSTGGGTAASGTLIPVSGPANRPGDTKSRSGPSAPALDGGGSGSGGAGSGGGTSNPSAGSDYAPCLPDTSLGIGRLRLQEPGRFEELVWFGQGHDRVRPLERRPQYDLKDIEDNLSDMKAFIAAGGQNVKACVRRRIRDVRQWSKCSERGDAFREGAIEGFVRRDRNH